MFILIPKKFFVPVKYIDKGLLHLYGKIIPIYDKKQLDDNKNITFKKHKYRDSIIEYFNDSDKEETPYDTDIDKIFTEIDDEYVAEMTNDKDKELENNILDNNILDNENEDLFLELNNDNINEV